MRLLWIADPESFTDAALTSAALLAAAPAGVEIVPCPGSEIGDLNRASPRADGVVVAGMVDDARSALVCTRPFVTLETAYENVSRVGHLLGPTESFLSVSDPWSLARRRLWASPHRRHSFFQARQQMGVHAALCDHVGVFLDPATLSVLGPVFDQTTLARFDAPQLSLQARDPRWLILDGPPLLGATLAWVYALSALMPVRMMVRRSASDVLDLLGEHVGVIFMPATPMPCPRIVIEAIGMGAQVLTNDGVQARQEQWYRSSWEEGLRAHLATRAEWFWSLVTRLF